MRHWDTVISPAPGGTEIELNICLKRQRCCIPEVTGLMQESLLILHSLSSYPVTNSSGFHCVKSKLSNSNLLSQLLPLRDHVTTEKTPEATQQKGAINSSWCETAQWKRKQSGKEHKDLPVKNTTPTKHVLNIDSS